MPDARRKAVGPKDQIIKCRFLLPSQTEDKGTRNDCLDVLPCLLCCRAALLLRADSAFQSRDWSKQPGMEVKGEKKEKERVVTRREKRKNSITSALAISQRVESRFIAVMVNNLKKSKALSSLYSVNINFILQTHSNKKKKILTFHLETSFSSPYLLELLRKHFQARG